MEIVIKVNSTYNNTIVSALYRGKILKTISTGSLGFKKAKRASTLAAQTCGEVLGSWLLQLNKNIGLAQKTRKLGLSEGVNYGLETRGVLEYSVLQEAKKKVTSGKQGSKKSGLKESRESPSRRDGGAKNVAKKEILDVSYSEESSLDKEIVANNYLKGVPLKSKTREASFLIKQVSLLISGVGYGKFGVIRGLSKLGIKIKTISDVTTVPHNGCKPPKMRRK